MALSHFVGIRSEERVVICWCWLAWLPTASIDCTSTSHSHRYTKALFFSLCGKNGKKNPLFFIDGQSYRFLAHIKSMKHVVGLNSIIIYLK